MWSTPDDLRLVNNIYLVCFGNDLSFKFDFEIK